MIGAQVDSGIRQADMTPLTPLQLAKRLAITWFSVSWFAYFVFDVLKDGHGSRLGRAIVAGFFVALTTAPAYYWRLRSKDRSTAGERR